MKTTIIAVRHGETEWNRIAKQQGHLDSPLTEHGIVQAKAMDEGLKAYRIDKFYSSDLGRAIQTSEIIQDSIHLGFENEIRLRERHLGILQGLTKREFKVKYPNEWRNFEKNDPDYTLPDGESIQQRFQRAIQCIENLTINNMGKTLLIVSHGGILMSLFYRALNLPLTQSRTFSLFNGSINSFSIDENLNWCLDSWGNIDHLRRYGLDTLDDN